MTSILMLLLMMLVSTFANQIIFEQVGEMASSVTYLHVKLEVDIQDIEDNVYEYQQLFPKIREYFEPLYTTFTEKLRNTNVFDIQRRVNDTEDRQRELDQALDARLRHTEKFLEAIQALRNALPAVNEDNSKVRIKRTPSDNNIAGKATQGVASGVTSTLIQRLIFRQVPSVVGKTTAKQTVKQTIKQAAKFIVKQGAGALLGVGLGALGTFMGLFNTYQIHNLKKELNEQREAHNRLVEVVQEQGNHIQQMDEALDNLKMKFDNLRRSQSFIIGNELGNIEEQIWSRINKVTHVIQVAQTRRLAIDFLPAEHLPRLYQQLETQAQAINHKLITKQPSDLFQLELSYFYDGVNMQLLLHVPTVPIDSILRLLKLHPFPLPLNKNYSVIPLVQDDLLAISSGFTRYSAQLSSVDLLGCHEINSVYLCERHGVLGKQLNNSCLGALYLQDFELAQELCNLQITPALEIVRQLFDNWFLVFTPFPQTAYVSCRNGTNTETYLKSGITKTYLSPGCKMNLKAHLLQSDHSLHLPDEVVNFQWDWDIAHITETLEQDMDILRSAGNTKPTLKDLKNLKINRTKTVLYRIFKISIISLVALAIVAVLVIWCFFKDLLFKVPCIKNYLKRIKKHQPRKTIRKPLATAPTECRELVPVTRNLLDLSPPDPEGQHIYMRIPTPPVIRMSTPPRQRLYPSLNPELTYMRQAAPRRQYFQPLHLQPLYQTQPPTVPDHYDQVTIPIPSIRRTSNQS
jgi:hypothetical protein